MAKRRKKPLLTRLQKKADKAFSLYIRSRDHRAFNGHCVICKIRPIQCAFHFCRRGRKSTRWDERNAVATCHRCNYLEYRNPDPARAWYIRTFGVNTYLAIVELSIVDFTPTVQFLESTIVGYTKKLEELRKLPCRR